MKPTLAHRQAESCRSRNRVGELGHVPAPHGQAPRKSSDGRPRREESDPLPETLDLAAGPRTQTFAQAIDPLTEIVLRRHDHFGCGGGRWSADVGNEVGNRHVNLVANRRNDWHRRARNRPGDDLLVESPEVLNRSAASTHDDYVYVVHASDGVKPPRDGERCTLTLHTGSAQDDLSVPIPAAQDLDDVPNSRAVERGHDTYLAWERRQRPLAPGIEQPFELESLLDLLEGQLQGAKSLWLERLANELVFALCFVDRHAAARDDSQTVCRLEPQAAERGAKDDGTYLSRPILQREV
jgi:hypothetical protein